MIFRLLFSVGIEELRKDSDRQIISNLFTALLASKRLTFLKFCAVKLFKFQWQIEKLNQELLFLESPVFNSTSPQSNGNVVSKVIKVSAIV